MLTTESLLVVLLLLPGFLAGRVFSLVAVQRRRNALEQFGEVVLFEFLVMCVYAAGSDYLGWPALVWPDSEALGSRTVDILRDNSPALSSLLGISVISGVGIGWMHNTDQPLTLLRHFGMTKQSTHATVWQGTLYSQSRWMIAHLASGERVIGWPAQFSDTPEEGALFLTQAAFVGKDDRLTEIRGPGILLTKEAGIRMVEFLDVK